MNKHKMHTNYKDDWETPKIVFDTINATFDFRLCLDVAASKDNSKCADFYTKEYSALEHLRSWAWCHVRNNRIEKGMWFCNPPFSLVEEFLEKAHYELKNGNEGIMIVPSNQETKWFRELIVYPNLPRVTYRRRIPFLHPETKQPMNGNPVGSVIVAFIKDKERLSDNLGGEPWVTNINGRIYNSF